MSGATLDAPVSTIEARVQVRCRECGDPVNLSARRARTHRQRGTVPVCATCRGVKPRELTDAERERLRSWWLERYTLDELREIGRLLLPLDADRPRA